MKELEIKTLKFIKNEGLIEKGDRILVAVSGGVDSVSLLYVLKDLMSTLEIPAPTVAHVNHKLRGAESDRDEEFVKKQAEGLGLQFISRSFNIRELAQEERSSIQETARKYRLKFLEGTAEKLNCTKIAVGHNQDDLAETSLMWIARGAGLKGATGILPRRDNFIRPLLCCSRREIAYFAEKRGVIHIEDSSNSKLDYIRNIFRHEIIPHIETKCYSSAKKNLARFAELLRKDMDYLDGRAMELTRGFAVVGENNDVSIEIDDLLSLHPAIQARIVRQMIKDVTGDLENISYLHVEKILEICLQDESGRKRLSLPGDIEAIRTYSRLLIRPKLKTSYKEYELKDNEYDVKYPGTTIIEPLKLRVDIELLAGGKAIEKYHFDDKYIAFINFDKTKLPLKIRFPHQGDVFVPLGSTGTKKLSDFFIDNKIPADERWTIPLLTDAENIIWITGHRMNELYRLDYTCKNVLMVKVSWL